jgi:predicted enzyme related to lactoylglutathione lyase
MGQPVKQFQIIAKNPDQAADFYCDLFEWTVNRDNALDYRAINTGSDEGITGGIWPAPPEGHGMVQLFVEVDDVAATAQRAAELGAKTIIPPQSLPDGDQMAVLLDPEGITFGLFKPAASK